MDIIWIFIVWVILLCIAFLMYKAYRYRRVKKKFVMWDLDVTKYEPAIKHVFVDWPFITTKRPTSYDCIVTFSDKLFIDRKYTFVIYNKWLPEMIQKQFRELEKEASLLDTIYWSNKKSILNQNKLKIVNNRSRLILSKWFFIIQDKKDPEYFIMEDPFKDIQSDFLKSRDIAIKTVANFIAPDCR